MLLWDIVDLLSTVKSGPLLWLAHASRSSRMNMALPFKTVSDSFLIAFSASEGPPEGPPTEAGLWGRGVGVRTRPNLGRDKLDGASDKAIGR